MRNTSERQQAASSAAGSGQQARMPDGNTSRPVMDYEWFLEDAQPFLYEIANAVHDLWKRCGGGRIRKQLNHWNATVDAVHEQIKDFERRHLNHYATRVVAEVRLRDLDAGPPAEGWSWGHERVGDGGFTIVYGWAPPELDRSRMPEVHLPVPIPDWELNLPEKYAALAAVHDRCWKGGKVNPWPLPPPDIDDNETVAQLKRGQHFHTLLYRVPEIEAVDEHFVRDMLRDVTADWAADWAAGAESVEGVGNRSPIQVDDSSWPKQADVAKRLGVERHVVNALLKKGELKDNGKQSHQRRVDPASIIEYCHSRGVAYNDS